MNFRLINADVLDGLHSLPDCSIDAIVTDPPYELGFMGRAWDASGIANSVPMWREALRVLKPGGHLLTFGGTRTYHRMTCGIEDAGFEIRDCIQWLHGSGFPKSLDVSKAIDKAAGAEREPVGVRVYAGGHIQQSSAGHLSPPIGTFKRSQDARVESAPSTVGAREWQGWGTALKPAYESITWAQKPLDPFTGSGTTGIAAIGEGFNFIGIEREPEFIEIARRRIQNCAPMFAKEIT